MDKEREGRRGRRRRKKKKVVDIYDFHYFTDSPKQVVQGGDKAVPALQGPR